MSISDWSSDVCSSDLVRASRTSEEWLATPPLEILRLAREAKATPSQVAPVPGRKGWARRAVEAIAARLRPASAGKRSEEHTSELQSLMRISYAVFCLKKKKK